MAQEVGFTHSDHVQGLTGQEWSAAFVFICAKKDTAGNNVSNLRRCTEGREVSGVDGPQSPQGLPLRAGEGTQGWLAHPGGGSSLPDWLTFQCHSRSRGASPLLLVTGVMLACCLSTARQSPAAVTAKLWGLGAAPPYPHASKLDSTCSSGPILNSSCSENLGAEILSSPLAVLPPPTPAVFTFLNVLKTLANSKLHSLC